MEIFYFREIQVLQHRWGMNCKGTYVENKMSFGRILLEYHGQPLDFPVDPRIYIDIYIPKSRPVLRMETQTTLTL